MGKKKKKGERASSCPGVMLIQGVKSEGFLEAKVCWGEWGGGKMRSYSPHPSWKTDNGLWNGCRCLMHLGSMFGRDIGEEGVGSVPKTEREAREVLETLLQTHQKEGGNLQSQASMLNLQTHPYLPRGGGRV